MANEVRIGRRDGIGFGIGASVEATAAPQEWYPWLSQSLQPKLDRVENESALGVVEKINDSAITGSSVEGTIEGKITGIGIGYPLLGIFGKVTDGVAVSGIYPHTFDVNQSSVPPAITVTRATPTQVLRHGYATFDTFELSAETNQFVQFSSAIKARDGVESADVFVSPTTQVEFTSKHIVLKYAENVAGIGVAPMVNAKSLKLNLSRPSEMWLGLGSSANPIFDRTTFEASGEFVVRHDDPQVEEDFRSNAIKAMSVKLTNGTTSLEFVATKVRFTELESSGDRDEIVTQSINFSCEFDVTVGRTIQAVLKNGKATYAAA